MFAQTIQTVDFPVLGSFKEFVSDVDTCQILTNMYEAVEEYQLWNLFEWNTLPIDIMTSLDFIPITKKLESDGHSGASMAFCVSHMKLIRKIGWPAYCVYMVTEK